MQTFHHGAVAEIPNTSRGVYAFAVNGHVDDDTSEALAKYMNDVFDRQEKVHMLFDLSGYSGSDGDALL
ncbi:MAG: STAS/SEC14 domain-containing protein, partial [Pseudomonadota bacterium]